MSLVGNLEDLSLGDILQIVSLSRKSGVLALSSDLGSGRIVFCDGLVQAACLKGHPDDLRELLVGEAVIDPAGFDAALSWARDHGMPVEETLSREAGISQATIHELITNAAEAAILEMFSWPSGDFSFDVRSELDPEDPHLILPKGINAQYLAMEGLRIRDERSRDSAGESDFDPNAETNPKIGIDQDPLFGADLSEVDEEGDDLPLLEAEPLEEGDADFEHTTSATDLLVERVVERTDDATELSLDDLVVASPLPNQAPAIGPAVGVSAPLDEHGERPIAAPALEREPTPTRAAETREGIASGSPDPLFLETMSRMPVVLIDPDVTALEWVRSAIEDDFARVHMFQKADQGLTRIRQYLIRGTTPLVLVSPETPIDPLSGIHGLADFVKRLKAQSPRIVVLGLGEDDERAPTAMPGNLNGVLQRPARRRLADKLSAEGAMASQAFSHALQVVLARQAGGERTGAESHRGLRDATDMCPEASSRGERSHRRGRGCGSGEGGGVLARDDAHGEVPRLRRPGR